MLKRSALRLLTSPALAAVTRVVLRQKATILMLHRIEDRDLGIDGDPPDSLRRSLAYLRKHKYELLGLDEMLARSVDRAPLGGCVVFTIDDGYREQAALAGPILAEFDCPATVFLSTGFIDRSLWFWWDQIEYMFTETVRSSVRLTLDGVPIEYQWNDGRGRDTACLDFTARCKEVLDAQKLAAIAALAVAAEVSLPDEAPSRYAPMTWDEARSWEARGMRFGAHTVTHPVLSRVDDVLAEHEIAESWARLNQEMTNPSTVFCYPNGRYGDFGSREVTILRRLGLTGAVIAEPGYADTRHLAAQASRRYEIPRFSYHEDVSNLVQCVSGLEHVKSLVRGRT